MKYRWLKDDLAKLGLRVEPYQIACDAPCSAPQALGTMYVLEGATLGLRQSLRVLPEIHPAHGPANRLVLGYGEHTGAHWKTMETRLGDVDPLLWPDVVTGARAAFRAFETHFSDRLHAEINSCTHG